MSLETGTRIADLVATNPVGATDFASQGDDHIRLIKACVQGSLPNLGATAMTCTAEELNKLDGMTADQAELNKLDGLTPSTAELNYMLGVTSAVQTQLDSKISTSAAIAAFQPLDSDLTAIAALTTTSFGRGFLDLADLAALATKINALVPSWSSGHKFLGNSSSAGFANAKGVTLGFVGSGGHIHIYGNGGTNEHNWDWISNTSAVLELRAVNDGFSDANSAISITRSGYTIVSVSFGAPLLVGATRIESLPVRTSTSTTLAKGQLHHIAGNATLPALSDGEWVCIVNNSGSDITISEHSGDTTYWSTGQVSVTTVTLQARGRMFASGAGSSVVYVTGDITGYT